jgi:hypothetical protein
MVRRSLRSSANLMKKALAASVLLNIALAFSAIMLLELRNSSPTRVENPTPPGPLPTELSGANTSNTAERTFNWSELESENYRTYITNLRRIGCPEQTIRDIITADVASLYGSRRTRLESDSVQSQNRTDQSVALRQEETWVVATLLGDASPTSASLGFPDIPPRSGRTHARHETVSMPLVFQDVDLSELKLNRDQLQAIDDLRHRFLDEIGGADQNPNDPAYRERWLGSQPQIDNDLRGMIGVAAFQNYQIEAADLAERRKTTK